jgi:hypothetical protein
LALVERFGDQAGVHLPGLRVAGARQVERQPSTPGPANQFGKRQSLAGVYGVLESVQ